mgnify:CR=1 FL=1
MVRRQTRAHIAVALTSPDDTDEVWETLQYCNVTLSLSRLLDPVLHFWDMLICSTNIAVALLAPTPAPQIQDGYCHMLIVTIHDHEIPGVVIDGGSGVNVISEDTSLDLGNKH